MQQGETCGPSTPGYSGPTRIQQVPWTSSPRRRTGCPYHKRNVDPRLRVSERHVRRLDQLLAGRAGKHICFVARNVVHAVKFPRKPPLRHHSSRTKTTEPLEDVEAQTKRVRPTSLSEIWAPTYAGSSNESTPRWTQTTSLPKPFEELGKGTLLAHTVFVEQIRDKVHTSLGASFTRKFDPNFWKPTLTSACDPGEAFSDWLRSGCLSGMSASQTEVRGVFSAAILKSRQFRDEQLSHQWRADKHRNYKSFHAEGGHLAKSEIDRIAGKDDIELFDSWVSVICRLPQPTASMVAL